MRNSWGKSKLAGKLIIASYLMICMWIAISGLSGCKITTDPPPVPINDKIIAVMWKPVQCTVHWVNRGNLPVGTPAIFTDDGNIEHSMGLAYSVGCDDYNTFRRKMNTADPNHQARQWSFYTCVPSNDPNLDNTFKPAGRGYADGNCNDCCQRPICYEADICPGLPCPYPTCTWRWAGARCFCTTVQSLLEADPTLGKEISIGMEQNAIWGALYDGGVGRGQLVSHDDIQEGDLVFMNLGFSGPGGPGHFDHIAIISYVAPNHYWEGDSCVGNIGFYADPFKYKASEADMCNHDDAIYQEWPYFYNLNPPYNWGLVEGRCYYLRVFNHAP